MKMPPIRFAHCNTELSASNAASTFLILDIWGVIIGCDNSAARLLSQTPELIIGQPAIDIIPNLPFATNTPYFNLAYAVFHATDGFELELFALTGDGNSIPITISLSYLMIKRRRLILMSLKAVKSKLDKYKSTEIKNTQQFMPAIRSKSRAKEST